MSALCVPFHLDDHLPDLTASGPAGEELTRLTPALPAADVWTRLVHLYGAVADVVEQQVRGGQSSTVVSGDCMVSIGMAAGLQRAGVFPAVVWIDAHGDLQTLETTSSGYLGGLALRHLLGYRPELLAERLGLHATPDEQVLLVGARDLDPPELDLLATGGIRRSTVEELSAGLLPDGPLLVNLDLDVLDPVELPGLRYPASGGPSPETLVRAARTLLDTGRVRALNVACTWVTGTADRDGVRAELVSALLDGR